MGAPLCLTGSDADHELHEPALTHCLHLYESVITTVEYNYITLYSTELGMNLQTVLKCMLGNKDMSDIISNNYIIRLRIMNTGQILVAVSQKDITA